MNQAFRFAFIICALAFLSSLYYHPYEYSYLVKILPIASLALLVLYNRSGAPDILICVGLLFSAGGDISLDIDRKKYFVIGLSFFLVAHVFYAISFALTREVIKSHLFKMLIVQVFVILMFIALYSELGDLLIPVAAYMLVIGIMASFAALQSANISLLGAAIFMASDSLIAINKFLDVIPYAGLCIIFTYYLGQWLIAEGTLQRKKLST